MLNRRHGHTDPLGQSERRTVTHQEAMIEQLPSHGPRVARADQEKVSQSRRDLKAQ